jgi:hypothetical protein
MAAMGVCLVVIVLAVLAARVNERALRRTIGGQRSFDAGRVDVRQLRRYELSGDVLPAQDDGPRGAALAPYQPQPIRVGLPRAEDAPAWELTRHTAQRTPALESDVFVPGLQAVFTALAAFIGSGLIAWALGLSWRVPVVVTGLALAGSWLWRMGVVTALLWRVESVMQRDLTGDGQLGKPTPQHAFTVANPADARADVAAQQRTSEQDERRARLLAFAHRCFTHGTSERAHGVAATGPDRDRYLECRDVLLALGLAQWRNPERPKAGWQMVGDEASATGVISRHVL